MATRARGANNRGTRGEHVSPLPSNLVQLRGRLSALSPPQALPSGDTLVSFRVVVDRPPRRGAVGRRVDSIDCQAVAAAPRRALGRCAVGALVEVEGALRRRFFRSGEGVASRYEVEAARVRRVRDGPDPGQ